MRRTLLAIFLPTLLALLLLPLLAGCREAPSSGGSAGGVPRRLRVSMVPNTDPGRILRESQPLTSYLEKEMGASVDINVPMNYAAVVEALVNDQVDIAYLGGFTYVQASRRAGVRPLVQRDRDRSFHSLFITAEASPIRSLADLKGRSFAFGDVNSTSGHLMPELYMREQGVDPEIIAKAIYTGGHDATALAVMNGKIDAGALDEAVYQRMTAEGKLARVRVFYTTPAFVDYVWVARKGLDPESASAFSRAFLKLDPASPLHKPLLDLLSANRYIEADDASYDKLREAARQAGLLR
jgi:phosphonate transport system substrate-binding protein